MKVPIPARIRRVLEAMPRMRQCELRGAGLGPCDGPLQWHHVFQYGGRSVQEVWAILCGCQRHHDLVKEDAAVREEFECRSLTYASASELAKYPMKDWRQIKRYLFKKI